MNDISRIKELVEELNMYADMYYDKDAILISDAEYDELYDELIELEAKTGTTLPNSPTLRVGGKLLSGFKEHTHINRLWSLDKCKSYDELTSWDKRNKKALSVDKDIVYSLEYKFDGLALNLTYNDGKLIQAATRGNGIIGEGILPQVMTINSIPLSVDHMGLFEIQGEGIMRLSTLSKYNETASEPLKNARNAAAGALRNLDPRVTSSRHLDCFLYQVGYSEDLSFADHGEMNEFINTNGFKTSDFSKKCIGINDVINQIKNIADSRDKLDFLIDGMVIKIWDYQSRQKLGYTHRFPRWAMAYKFEAEEISTTVEGIAWQVGRTGRITPVAELSPVDLGGVTVKRATLNNFGDIQKKKVKIGSRVLIRRSNDVIPEILGALDHDGQDINLIEKCPSCDFDTVEIGAHLFCQNSACPPQIVGKLVHFASRDAMNIESLNDKTAEQLYQNLNVHTVADLYSLTKEELLTLDGFKEKKADNLLAGIEKSKNSKLPNFIFALGINNVGLKTANDIAKTFGSISELSNATFEQLIAIPDIGEIVAKAIVNYFDNQINKELLNKLFELGVTLSKNETQTTNILNDKTFVITGTLDSISRKEVAALIESNGGKVTNSVSKKTSYLLAGESAGSKLTKAQDLNIEIIDIDNLMEMIKG